MDHDPLPEISSTALPSGAEALDIAIRGVLGGAPCDELEGMLAARMPAARGALQMEATAFTHWPRDPD